MSNSSSNHFYCPSGGTWYVCPDAPHFVGCCSSDPCANVDANSSAPCPNVYPASFDTSIFDSILPNLCIDAVNKDWYSCNTTDPPFFGCCSINACQNSGCPADDLLAAAWSPSKQGQFALFQDEDTGDDNNEGSGGGGGLSGGAIAGIVVGGVAALVIVGVLVWFFMRRRNKEAATMSGDGHTPSVVEGEHMHQRMYPSPASLYHNSQFSSPAGTTTASTITGAGKDPKYMTYSPGVSLPSLSPGHHSGIGRPISDRYSNSTGSEDMSQQKWMPGQTYGLGVHGAQKPEPIQELDSSVAEIHELDGRGGNRSW
ncbi:hypothetical protein N7478_007147 [Penicillium angulare]|uniref:uncharacterized protein n=1 Tax=Penicillium angulare TaxID=116970 RepID=UPI0025422509|nr:uncharacterized protein N7478_007147 [Penicillium angulare]KAJ5281775.1 hypothetical protein N7478_007147 [Penicillium angulare]